MIQHQNNNNSGSASNLKVSTDTIIFHPENHTSEIVLSNLHQKYTLYFKIKTKIQKVFDVKPSIGSIKPGEQQTISFKAIKKIEANQMPNLQQNLQFQVQAVNHTNPALNKQEEQNLWKEIKAKKANVELGYGSVKLGISFSGNKSKAKEVVPIFNKVLESKIDSRYSSEVGKSTKFVSSISNLPNSPMKSSSNEKPVESINDEQLSKKYEQLKQKQQQLIKQRQKIFEGAPAPKKSKGPSPVKLVIILILTFLLGNFLRSVFQPKQIPKQEEKGLFDWLS